MNRSYIKTNAPSNYFTLLDWVNVVLLLSAEDQLNFTAYLGDLVIWQATLLHRCISEGKRGVKASAIRGTRASLKAVFAKEGEPSFGGKAVESFIKALTGPKIPPFVAAIGLGVVAGVCRGLREPTPSSVIESSKSTYYDFFIKEVVGSKSSVPDYVLVFARLGKMSDDRPNSIAFLRAIQRK